MLSDILNQNLRLLQGVSAANKDRALLLVEAERNTWSRSARRSRHRFSTTLENLQTPSSRQPALTCSIQVIDTSSQTVALEFQWLYGTDRTLFESFVSHVLRKVGHDLVK